MKYIPSLRRALPALLSAAIVVGLGGCGGEDSQTAKFPDVKKGPVPVENSKGKNVDPVGPGRS